MLGNLRKTLQYCRRKTFFIYLAVKKWHDIFMMKLLQWKDVNSVYRTLRVLLHANLLNDRSMPSFTCTYTTGKEKKKTLRLNYRSLSDEQNLTLNLSYIRFWSKFNKVTLMYSVHSTWWPREQFAVFFVYFLSPGSNVVICNISLG